MRVRFFRALAGTCAGTKIFTELQSQSLGRTFWHLLLTTFLAAVICAVGVGSRLSGVGRMAAEQLQSQCGGIMISARGMEPVMEPEKARDFLLPGLLRVTYLPAAKDGVEPRLPDGFPGASERGVLWMPERIGVWDREKNNTYRLHVATQDPGRFGEVTDLASSAELLTELRRAPAMLWRQFGEREKYVFSAGKMLALWKLLLAILLPPVLFARVLFRVVLYMAMFAAVFWLMSLRQPTRRPLREVIVLAVYAGFPAMLVGALAAALDLPYLDFNWIYVLGMTGYLMTVMSRLERDRREVTGQHA